MLIKYANGLDRTLDHYEPAPPQQTITSQWARFKESPNRIKLSMKSAAL